MDAVAIVRNRLAGVRATLGSLAESASELSWQRPVLPGTSPIGLTFWHLPRTVDWLVNTTVRGVPEVADDGRFGDLPDPDRFGFGTGLLPAMAEEAAAQVHRAALAAYTEAVVDTADDWLATLTDDDLDQPVPDFLARQQARPSYATPAALAEVQGLVGLPVGMLLARPTMGHLFMHLGELGVLVEHATRTAES